MAEARRLEYIDGLRGIAAAMVVFQHAIQIPHGYGSPIYDWSLFSLNFGRVGVELFFLISGFVIPYSFRGNAPIRAFWWSRLFRLYPAYWLSIPVMIALIWARGHEVDPMRVLANLTMLQTTLGYENLGFGYWTLNYEMWFYLICTALFAVGFLRSTVLVGCACLLGLAGSVATHLLHDLRGIGTEYDFPFFVAVFFLGLLLRRAFLDGNALAARWCVAVLPLTVLTAAHLGGLFYPVGLNLNVYFRPLVLSLSMMLPPIAFVLVLWWQPKVPRWLVWLGAVSYSLYLFQDPWLVLLPRLIAPGLHPILFAIVCCAGALLSATVVHYAFERPMMKLGRRWSPGKAREAAGASADVA